MKRPSPISTLAGKRPHLFVGVRVWRWRIFPLYVFCRSGGFPAGHEEDGFVVEAGGSECGLDGDLFLDVDIFRAGFDAEGSVFPDAEFDPLFEPCDAEAAARFVQREHVGDEEFDAKEVVDFSVGEGGKAVVAVLGLLHEEEVHVLFSDKTLALQRRMNAAIIEIIKKKKIREVTAWLGNNKIVKDTGITYITRSMKKGQLTIKDAKRLIDSKFKGSEKTISEREAIHYAWNTYEANKKNANRKYISYTFGLFVKIGG